MKRLRMDNLNKVWKTAYQDIVQNNALSQGKSKKSSKVVKKVLSITDKTKNNILALYFKHCELKHKIKFLKFRLESIHQTGDDFTNQLVAFYLFNLVLYSKSLRFA